MRTELTQVFCIHPHRLRRITWSKRESAYRQDMRRHVGSFSSSGTRGCAVKKTAVPSEAEDISARKPPCGKRDCIGTAVVLSYN